MCGAYIKIYIHFFVLHIGKYTGAKCDWDFRISDKVKIPDGTNI